jgi:hypothetical protein
MEVIGNKKLNTFQFGSGSAAILAASLLRIQMCEVFFIKLLK